MQTDLLLMHLNDNVNDFIKSLKELVLSDEINNRYKIDVIEEMLSKYKEENKKSIHSLA